MSNQNTSEFLSHFNASTFLFQAKDDGKGTKDKATVEKYGRIYHKTGPFNSSINKWLRDNNRNAWGCFFTVNELDQSLDPKHKRTETMLTRIRAVWVEDDTPREEPRDDFPLKPSLIVNSSPGKYHYYFLTDLTATEENKAEWNGVMRRMVKDYGCDNNAKDLCRVLRLPGYNHCKHEPHMVTFEGTGETYTWEQITTAFEPLAEEAGALSVGGSSGGVATAELIEDYEAGHRHGPSSKMAMKLANYNLPKDEIVTILTKLFPENNLAHHEQSASSAVGKVEAEKKEKKKDQPRFNLIRAADIVTRAPSWIIKNYLEKECLAQLFSDPGVAKTFLMLDWSLCIATGTDWNGHKATQGPVIYVCGEGQSGVKRRIDAWAKHHGVDLTDVPFFVSLQPAALTDSESLCSVITSIDEIVKTQGVPLMIGVDTLNRNFGPGDENSTQDMTAFIGALDQVKSKYGCTIMLAHHTGHADKTRGRGSMALKGALDAEYRLDKDEVGVIRLEGTKMKDGPTPALMAFQLVDVDLGFVDEDGIQVKSAVLESTAYEPTDAKIKLGLGKLQTIALEALKVLHMNCRDKLEAEGRDTNTTRVGEEEWRDACKQKGIARNRFKETKDGLVKRQLIIIKDGFVIAV